VSTPPRDLSLQCRCGTVRAVLRGVALRSAIIASATARIARPSRKRWTGRRARRQRRTDIFQLCRRDWSSHRVWTAWRVLRLTRRDSRVGTRAAATPIGNTMATRGIPFVGVIRAFVREPQVTRSAPSARADSGSLRPAMWPLFRLTISHSGACCSG